MVLPKEVVAFKISEFTCSTRKPSHLVVSGGDVEQSDAVCRVAGVHPDLTLLALTLARWRWFNLGPLHGLEAGSFLGGQGSPARARIRWVELNSTSGDEFHQRYMLPHLI